MLWPPASDAPASTTFSNPPRRIWRTVSAGIDSGTAMTLSAVMGVPPMAYTSESALAAATCPNTYGSSTMGGKKSTVCTIARSSRRRYTAASSEWSNPTSRLGSRGASKPSKSLASCPAPTFAPHPAHSASLVSLTSSAMAFILHPHPVALGALPAALPCPHSFRS